MRWRSGTAPFAFTFSRGTLGEGDIGLARASLFSTSSEKPQRPHLAALRGGAWRSPHRWPGKDASLEAAARFGYAVVEKLAVASTEGRVPMKLDY
jgi:hypothetical protein